MSEKSDKSLMSESVRAFTTCDSGFAAETTAQTSFASAQQTRCNSVLCASASCVTSVSMLRAGFTCLNVTQSTDSDISDLSDFSDICVIINQGVRVKNVKLPKGDNCLLIQNNALVGDISTGDGNDFIVLNGTARDVSTHGGKDIVSVTAPGKLHDLNTGSDSDIVLFTNVTANDVNLGSGNDYILVSGGTSSSPANLTLIHSLNLGPGNDAAVIGYTTINDVEAGSGRDRVSFKNSAIGSLEARPIEDVVGVNFNTSLQHVEHLPKDTDSDDDDDDVADFLNKLFCDQ